ncbi:DBR1-domain-containing protein [Aaosphaeria arxii CBS 175.79]|uniref:DBR1-domain-containing protein n=1 Tax=Aaosphaeria arxii CBS 175.79 TaxID=1450172 RepID=A0A6A5Y1P1_9PLEO|nr:DBR1-domain-containing protein [Aaosphaeria arxii CBS 175.79]KAF2018977.1 DBR1-domain-containing protein [Aaosphaeria arxii CBS 175.79]
MSSTDLVESQGLRIAVEGCGHGTLHSIYASVKKSCEIKGWEGVDLLIIGGDFQAVRNAHDLKAVSMPEKYYAMHDFHEYYSGARAAPYLTIFIGGNHEASNYMWELYYGGWAAPNIYYMGAANVVRLGPLRIAGLSGIWKGYNFKKPHFERLPYNQSDVRSIYHVRELDTRKLLQLRSQVDIGLSHDWPRGMEWKGNHRQLFRFKPDFEQEAKDGTLGSVAATTVLERLRPAHWFSAHMHIKYAAIWEHKATETAVADNAALKAGIPHATFVKNEDEIELDLDDPNDDAAPKADVPSAAIVKMNEDEIDLDLEDDLPPPVPKNDAEIDLDLNDDAPQPAPATGSGREGGHDGVATTSNAVPEHIRKLLPASFAPPSRKEPVPRLPFPKEITNTTTRFLALDKCLPNRHFLQVLEVMPSTPAAFQRPLRLEYDPEWLAITRVFAKYLQVGDPTSQVPTDEGDVVYRPLIEKEMEWIEKNVVDPGKLQIPEDFEQTAPVYDPTMGIRVSGLPKEYSNPHTQKFCELLQIPNPFQASEEEREQMMQQGPREEPGRDGRSNNSRRGGGYRGGHRDRGRGGHPPRGSRGRGYGRGRGGGRGGGH